MNEVLNFKKSFVLIFVENEMSFILAQIKVADDPILGNIDTSA